MDHVGIAVEAVESAWLTYTALGLVKVMDRRLEKEGVRAVLMGGSSRVELLEPLSEGPIRRFLDRRGEGLHHIAIRVEDLGESLATAKEEGMEQAGEVREGVDGRRIAFLHPRTTGGVLIELIEGQPPDVSRET